jgi:hypothetical protein
MNAYRFRLSPNVERALAVRQVPMLTEDAVLQALPGAIVRELADSGSGHYALSVQLGRSTHDEALDHLVRVLSQLSFSVLEIEVQDWATEAAERAFLGALGGGLVGAPSESPLVVLAAVVFGALVGHEFGANVHHLRARYEAWQNQSGGWAYRQLPLRQPARGGAQPGYSAA